MKRRDFHFLMLDQITNGGPERAHVDNGDSGAVLETTLVSASGLGLPGNPPVRLGFILSAESSLTIRGQGHHACMMILSHWLP